MKLTDDERRRQTERLANSARSTRAAQLRPSQDFDWDAAINSLKAMLNRLEDKR